MAVNGSVTNYSYMHGEETRLGTVQTKAIRAEVELMGFLMLVQRQGDGKRRQRRGSRRSSSNNNNNNTTIMLGCAVDARGEFRKSRLIDKHRDRTLFKIFYAVDMLRAWELAMRCLESALRMTSDPDEPQWLCNPDGRTINEVEHIVEHAVLGSNQAIWKRRQAAIAETSAAERRAQTRRWRVLQAVEAKNAAVQQN